MIAVLTPITWPALVTSGPPELPGIERRVGLNDLIDQPSRFARSVRPSALTTPAVTVCWKP